MALVGPFSVGYPVNFKSSGDTTRDAFGKHIQEIERIYGYLNALDAGKVSASDVSGLSGSISGLSSTISSLNTALTNHINSSNPHPNYKPSISWSDLTGTKPNLADFSGNLDASRINNLPSSGGSGDGITESSLSNNGYAKFGNGLIIHWGEAPYNSSQVNYYKFVKPFPSFCAAVNIQTHISNWANMSTKSYVGNSSSSSNPNINEHRVSLTLCDWDKDGFVATVTEESNGLKTLLVPLVYIAIGW